MEINFKENTIELNKELNALDKFTISFTEVLNSLNIKYVLIAGYVAIVFGRNRSSEDIDIFIEKLSRERFEELWQVLEEKFDCIASGTMEEAYTTYLLEQTAIRFAEKGKFIPNMEFKFALRQLEVESLKKRQKLLLNKNLLYISQFELEIAYKLFLGSEKDIEDARFLYKLFKERIDNALLDAYARKLKIGHKLTRYLL